VSGTLERWNLASTNLPLFFHEDSIFFFFFCLFLGPYPRHMEVPRLGVKLAVAAAYTTATATQDLSRVCGNIRSLTHWARPQIELVSSWMLVRFVSAEPRWELHFVMVKHSNLFSILTCFNFLSVWNFFWQRGCTPGMQKFPWLQQWQCQILNPQSHRGTQVFNILDHPLLYKNLSPLVSVGVIQIHLLNPLMVVLSFTSFSWKCLSKA